MRAARAADVLDHDGWPSEAACARQRARERVDGPPAGNGTIDGDRPRRIRFAPAQPRRASEDDQRERRNMHRPSSCQLPLDYSALTPAALTIGYHFSTSALWNAANAGGVC